VPTTLLSNRLGYPSIRGRVLEPQTRRRISCAGSRNAARSTPCEMILSGYLGSLRSPPWSLTSSPAPGPANPKLTYWLRSPCPAIATRGLFVPAGIPPLVARPVVPVGRHHHCQIISSSNAVRGEGHDVWSSDRSGARADGARSIDRRRHQRRAQGHIRTARSRPLPSRSRE